MSFGSRAHVAMQAYGPACIGIDPHPSLLEQWGLEDDIEGLDRFASTCVEAFAGRVAFVKPQSAFFERFGARGVVVLERTIEDLRHTGSLVVLDVKRGDIGSTAQAYADAYLDDDAPMAADAITVSPFLGFGSLAPFFEVAEKNDAGVFVLALTSNPEGPDVQHAVRDGRTVAESVLAQLAELNAGATPMGSFGAVVGATIDEAAARLVASGGLAINGPLLVPGYGAQGGTVDDIRRLFGDVMDQVVPSTSRGVLSAGPDVSALRDAAARVNAELVGS
ncbi:orotidine-5'-phosphate decarboxylase [Aeromicrobium fastidiosum]|uniref:orotidine-5'-phosphate decarboxylase n=1 Tax=Aeromicrobium fastidiosum TaxID=52699 RepID=UPI0020235C31|nr:orotidine-5'-phosphate decarboxylase [Aeromicrobium fastidiosum]MCL8252578.1 orotidine-5'-phosphate decarboxylase [Aeromicrobium fastidiosum]